MRPSDLKSGLPVVTSTAASGVIVHVHNHPKTSRTATVRFFDGREVAFAAADLAPDQFDDRTRFNWGFWDGAAELREARPLRHLGGASPAYETGYARGVAFAAANLETDSSEPAWSQLDAVRARKLAPAVWRSFLLRIWNAPRELALPSVDDAGNLR